MSQHAPELKVLIVCLGNICRSPMGEAVLRHISKERGVNLSVSSCGTAGYHVGEDADDRTIATCKKHCIPFNHTARQYSGTDFTKFTHILASDESNLRFLNRVKPRDATADVRLWGSYLDDKPIPDPYYGGMHDFERVYQQCVRLSNAFLDSVTVVPQENQTN